MPKIKGWKKDKIIDDCWTNDKGGSLMILSPLAGDYELIYVKRHLDRGEEISLGFFDTKREVRENAIWFMKRYPTEKDINWKELI